MIKYSADTLKDRALQLADLQNSTFIGWGEMTHYLNEAYRKVYQDCINAGDMNYVEEAVLLGNGTYDLPNDFYQLITIHDKMGNELRRLQPSHAPNDLGYSIRNGKIVVTGYNTGDIVLKYFPVPETITYKAPRQYVNVDISPSYGYGSMVMDNSGSIYDVVRQVSVKGTDGLSGSRCMGSDSFIVKAGETWNRYALQTGYLMANLGQYPFLLGNGSFISLKPTNVSNASFTYAGVASADGYHLFYVYDGHLYYWDRENDEINDLGTYTALQNAKYIYWNGHHAVVTEGRVIYDTGAYETTDSSGVLLLLKADKNTGYGYVCYDGNGYYIDGWTADTAIDYPNNVFFDLVAYSVAIRLRVKQNADTSGLENEYDKLYGTYFASLSSDEMSYPTIRNVSSRFSYYRYY